MDHDPRFLSASHSPKPSDLETSSARWMHRNHWWIIDMITTARRLYESYTSNKKDPCAWDELV